MASLTYLAPRAAPTVSALPSPIQLQYIPTPELQSGASRDSSSSSLSAFVSTLIPLLIVNGIYVTLFLVFRRKFQRIYEPRTFLGSIRPSQRTPRNSPGFLTWVKDFYALPDAYVLNHQSLDGYLYLRY